MELGAWWAKSAGVLPAQRGDGTAGDSSKSGGNTPKAGGPQETGFALPAGHVGVRRVRSHWLPPARRGSFQHTSNLTLAAQGRSLALTQGLRLKGEWWSQSLTLPDWLKPRLEVWRKLIEAVEEQLDALTKQVEALAPKVRPKGLGTLTLGMLIAELCDWSRFKNRKQIGSYTGLCGGVSSSGQSHCDLSITKAGNPRIRWTLIELAWRMVLYQPQSKAVQRWKHILLQPKAAARQKKRALVALARQLAVDLWRWQTGKITPEQLGWVMV